MKKTLTKNIFLLLSGSFFSLQIMAQVNASKINIALTDGKLKLNKKEVSKDWKLKGFTAVLDTFCRIKEGINKIYTYDQLGMVIFESTTNKIPTGTVAELQIFLDENEAGKIVPKNFFTGKVSIEKLDIDYNSTIEIIRKKITNYKETESDEVGKFRFSNNDLYIYFLYNRMKKLCKVTVGKVKGK